MIIDFHMHERTYSGDSHCNLRDMVKEAKIKGLDGICITDHDKYGIKDYAAKVSKEENFPIFVGVEYLAMEGDIIAFGIDELPVLHMEAQDFINWVNERGGVTISAHPYRPNSRGLGDQIKMLKGLTGVEVLNGSTNYYDNERALNIALETGLKKFGASDCHNLISLGRYATEIPYNCKTVSDLVYAIKNFDTKPVVLSGYKELKF